MHYWEGESEMVVAHKTCIHLFPLPQFISLFFYYLWAEGKTCLLTREALGRHNYQSSIMRILHLFILTASVCVLLNDRCVSYKGIIGRIYFFTWFSGRVGKVALSEVVVFYLFSGFDENPHISYSAFLLLLRWLSVRRDWVQGYNFVHHIECSTARILCSQRTM